MTAPVPSSLPRLNAIQVLRGIAAILVMVSHLWIIEQKYSPDQLLGAWVNFGMIGVDLFFAISGFIMVYVTQAVAPSAGAAGRFAFARIARIYPVHWVVSGVLFLLWLKAPDMVFSAFNQPPDILKSFTLWPDQRPPLLAVGWTLTHEVFFYLVFAISLLFSKRLLLPFLTGWAAVTMLGFAAGFGKTSPETALVFNPLTLEFILGAMAAWGFIRLDGKWSTPAISVGLTGFALAILLLVTAKYSMPTTPWLRTLYFSVPGALLVYGLAGLVDAGRLVPKILVSLGDWSYSLYLTHILTLSLLGKLWHPLATPGWLDNVLVLIFFALISILVAALCWRYIEKPLVALAKRGRQRLSKP